MLVSGLFHQHLRRLHEEGVLGDEHLLRAVRGPHPRAGGGRLGDADQLLPMGTFLPYLPSGHVLRAEGGVEGIERRFWCVGDGAHRGDGDAGRAGAAVAHPEGHGPAHPPLPRPLPQPAGRSVRPAQGRAEDALSTGVRQEARQLPDDAVYGDEVLLPRQRLVAAAINERLPVYRLPLVWHHGATGPGPPQGVARVVSFPAGHHV